MLNMLDDLVGALLPGPPLIVRSLLTVNLVLYRSAANMLKKQFRSSPPPSLLGNIEKRSTVRKPKSCCLLVIKFVCVSLACAIQRNSVLIQQLGVMRVSNRISHNQSQSCCDAGGFGAHSRTIDQIIHTNGC